MAGMWGTISKDGRAATGAAISGTIRAGATIFGGLKASKAMRRVRHNIEKQQKENEDWFNRRYYEDGTQRAEAQRMINLTNEQVRNRNRQAAGAAAVAGATDESVALAKASGNQATADVAAQIAADQGQRKDLIEEQYLNTKAQLNDQLNGLQRQKAANIAAAAKAVGDALAAPSDALSQSAINEGKGGGGAGGGGGMNIGQAAQAIQAFKK